MTTTLTAKKTPITVAYGDGIGPEIMDATLNIIIAAGAQIEQERIEIGESLYMRGISNGIEPSSWESLRRTKVFLKAPITTPQGGGFKSLNVTVRKMLGLYANVRPCISYAPYVETKHPKMDLVIFRENEEDVYGGIEYRQTEDTYQALKIITQPGSEKIIRYAFEWAKANKRKNVTAFTKDNILKMTDGLFHKIFDEIGEEYPEIEKGHWIVDIGAAKLADTPEVFDVLVMPNLYGDVLSDVAAQLTGSVGLAGSANVGEHCSMFEAIHGSAPRRAGQNMANPSGLLLGAVLMLVHIGQGDVAERVQNAWLKTMEDGIHTYDIYDERVSKQKVGTKEFAQAVIDRLGKRPTTLKAVEYDKDAVMQLGAKPIEKRSRKELVGVDVFLDWHERDPEMLAKTLQGIATKVGTKLDTISSRGTRVWPEGLSETSLGDHWRARFRLGDGKGYDNAGIIALLGGIRDAGLDFIKTENLYNFDGERAFSLDQGS